MYAVIETGGKQYRVQKGDTLRVEKILGLAGSECRFEHVLLVAGDGQMRIGTPVVEKAAVIGKILKQDKEKKVMIFKYKRRKNYRWKQGHRQLVSVVKIEDIQVG